jgi:hypothetical protein
MLAMREKAEAEASAEAEAEADALSPPLPRSLGSPEPPGVVGVALQAEAPGAAEASPPRPRRLLRAEGPAPARPGGDGGPWPCDGRPPAPPPPPAWWSR